MGGLRATSRSGDARNPLIVRLRLVFDQSTWYNPELRWIIVWSPITQELPDLSRPEHLSLPLVWRSFLRAQPIIKCASWQRHFCSALHVAMKFGLYLLQFFQREIRVSLPPDERAGVRRIVSEGNQRTHNIFAFVFDSSLLIIRCSVKLFCNTERTSRFSLPELFWRVPEDTRGFQHIAKFYLIAFDTERRCGE